MSKRDILVVFDIDETLIQFINTNAYHYWEDIKENKPGLRNLIKDNLTYVDLGDVKKQVIFFRPGLKDFLEMARDNGRIKVAIWTYSEREYARVIAELICKEFGLPGDTFIFKYGAEDIEDDDMPKSLTKIWNNPKFGKIFNKFNTFLVDDRFGNLCHEINAGNSILVQAFAPFGETKQREAPTEELLEKAIKDPVFHELTNITHNLLRDVDGCQDDEIEEAFKSEAIFAPKCIERKRLDSYVKNYDDIQLCTIGDVEHAASTFKGGKTFKKSTFKKSTFKKGRTKSTTFRKTTFRKGCAKKTFRKTPFRKTTFRKGCAKKTFRKGRTKSSTFKKSTF